MSFSESSSSLDAARSTVQEYYGKVLTKTCDLKTTASCDANNVRSSVKSILSRIPTEIIERYFGCGCPLPEGIESYSTTTVGHHNGNRNGDGEVCSSACSSTNSTCLASERRGLRVLDIGSGSGRDSYVLAALIGEQGDVVGVDMTAEQIAVADKYAESYCRSTLGYNRINLRFVHDYIENLSQRFPEAIGTPAGSGGFDLIVSNCVVNLTHDKSVVLSEVYKVLNVGGEFHLADMFADRRLPDAVRRDPEMIGEGLGGALYVSDFLQLCERVGFVDPRILRKKEIHVQDPRLRAMVGNARFYSITWRCFKLPADVGEPNCEDYGQIAVYNGTIQTAPHGYALDAGHRFETGKPAPVCGNTAAMLENTWLKPYFTVLGNRDTHYGLFPCGGDGGTGPETASSNSCSTSSCC